MNKVEVIRELEKYKIEKSPKKTLKSNKTYKVLNVKMKDIRAIAKMIGENHSLAVELFTSNIYEAMMLASIIASVEKTNYDLLTKWAKLANSSNIVNQGLSNLILKVDSNHHLMKEWCLNSDEDLRYAGYSILSSYFRSESLEKIDNEYSHKILNKIVDTIVSEPLTIQNAMNNAVVMAGLHVPALVEKATEVAEKIGYIMPLVAKNSCNIQSASDYLVRYIENPKYSRVAKLRQI